MPVPTLVTDLSATAASNYPAGTEAPNVIDDTLRAHAAFIASIAANSGNGWTSPYLPKAGGALTGAVTNTGSTLGIGTGGVGYGTGSGGAVTQGTSKSTNVTLNKTNGQITMHDASLAAGATVGFTLTNSTMAATDTAIVHRCSGGTNGSYEVWIDRMASGGCDIYIKNTTAGALAEAVVLNFSVIKAVAA
jgi:hypothetical protein